MNKNLDVRIGSVTKSLSSSKVGLHRLAAIAAVAVSAVVWSAGSVHAQATYSYTAAGFDYTQNFGALVYQSGSSANSNNPIALNSVTYTLPAAGTPFSFTDTTIGSGGNAIGSGMAGWWALCLGTSNRYGANPGDQTTGGIISYGGLSSTTRALGLIATSSSGIDETGMCLINNSGGNLNSLTISFSGELWRQTSTSKSLQFDYYLPSSGTSNLGTAVTSGVTVGALGVSYGTGSTANGSNSGPVTGSLISDTFALSSTWAPGQALWVTWEMPNAGGSGQGYGIGNLNISATETAVLPDTWNTTSGSWNTSAANWSGPANNKYTDGDTVIFGNISASSTVTVAPSVVNPASVTISNSANTYTFTGQSISGSGGLTMSGSGAAILAMANSYSGATTISGGTLVAAAGDASLGAASSAITISNGATLGVANSGIVSGRAITFSSGGGVFNTNSLSSSTSGNVAVNGPFSVTGGGSLTLTGNLTSSSSSSAPLFLATGTTLAAGGPIVAGGPANVDQTLLSSGGTINGTLVLSAPARYDIGPGSFGGTGAVQLTYAGSLANNGADTSGGTSVWTTFAGNKTLGGGTLGTNVVINPANPHTSADVTQQNFTLNTAHPFVVGIGTQASTVYAISGNISGNGDVVLGGNDTQGSGNGTVILAGSNTYLGTTLMAGKGIVQLGGSSALPATTDLVFNFPFSGSKNPILDLHGNNEQINSLESIPQGALSGPNGPEDSGTTGAFAITNSGSQPATLTISGATTPYYSYSGILADGTAPLGIVKGGSSLLVLSGGSNTYSGGTTVQGGTLDLAGSGAVVGMGPVSVLSSATLAGSGFVLVSGNTGAVTIQTGGALVPGVSGLGGFTFDNPGLTLANGSTTDIGLFAATADSIAGTGTLTLPASAPATIALGNQTQGGTFPLFSFNNMVTSSGSSVTGSTNLSQYLTLTGTNSRQQYSFAFSTTGTYSDTIDLIVSGTPASTDTWAVNSGSWDLTSTTNWTGGYPVSGQYKDYDNVVFGNITQGSTVTVTSGGVNPTSMTISNATTNSYTFTGGPIGGDGFMTLYKTGAGVAVLASSNTYTNGTSITGGTLVAQGGDNRLGAPSGPVTIDSGATLQTAGIGLASSRSLTIGVNGGTFDTNGLSSSLSGGLTLNGNLTKVSAGTLAQYGQATFNNSAVLIVNGGAVQFNGGLNFGANGSLQIGSSGSVILNDAGATIDQENGGVYNGSLVITAALRANFDGGTFSGSGGIYFPQDGARITNANSFSGGIIDVPVYLNCNNLPFTATNPAQTTISTSGANSFIATIGGTKNSNTASTTPSILTINGVISGNSDLNLSNATGGGGSGNITLGGQNTYTGATMIDFAGNSNGGAAGGQVVLTVSNALPTQTDVIFGAVGGLQSATLDLNGNNQSVGSISMATNGNGSGYNITNNSFPPVPATLTIGGSNSPAHAYSGYLSDGQFGGQLALVIAGPNSTTLAISGSGSSDYSGGTTVQGGALWVSSATGQSPSGEGDVTVTGGTFGGNATVGVSGQSQAGSGGDLIVGASGTVVAGYASAGTLSILNNATFSGGANAAFTLGSSSNTGLNVGGELTLPSSGALDIDFTGNGSQTPGTFPLITYSSLASTVGTNQVAIGSVPSGEAFALSNSGNSIVVAVTPSSTASTTLTGGTTSWNSALATSASSTVTLTSTSDSGSTITLDNSQNAGALIINSTTGGLTVAAGNGGHLILGSTNSSTQPTIQVNSGDASIADAHLHGNLTITMSSGTELQFADIHDETANGASLTLTGNGQLVLAGSGLWTGGTIVEGGTVVVDNAYGLESGSDVTIGDSASFGGIDAAGAAGGVSLTPVPEPGSLALLAFGAAVAGWGAMHRRFGHKRQTPRG